MHQWAALVTALGAPMSQPSPEDTKHHTPALLRKGCLAKTHKVSLRTIDSWMQGGVIPFIKVKRLTLFDLDRVMEDGGPSPI